MEPKSLPPDAFPGLRPGPRWPRLQRWQSRATTTLKPSVIYDISWRRNWHRRWLRSRIDYCNALLYGADRHHPETSACAVQRSSDRAPNAKTIPHQAAAAQPALVAGWSENHLQDGGGHIQSPEHCNTSLSQPTLTAPQLCAEFTVVGHSSTCCVNLSPKLTSLDVVSVTQHLPSGTHFLEQYSKVRQ